MGEYRKIQHNDNTMLNKFLMNLKTLIIKVSQNADKKMYYFFSVLSLFSSSSSCKEKEKKEGR